MAGDIQINGEDDMAEERSATMIGGVEAEVRALRNDSERRFDSLEQSMARMEGRFEQMDKRIGELSSQLDKRLSSMETAIDKRLSSTETTVGDLRRDIRQVFYFVCGAVIVPILIEVFRRVVH